MTSIFLNMRGFSPSMHSAMHHYLSSAFHPRRFLASSMEPVRAVKHALHRAWHEEEDRYCWGGGLPLNRSLHRSHSRSGSSSRSVVDWEGSDWWAVMKDLTSHPWQGGRGGGGGEARQSYLTDSPAVEFAVVYPSRLNTSMDMDLNEEEGDKEEGEEEEEEEGEEEYDLDLAFAMVVESCFLPLVRYLRRLLLLVLCDEAARTSRCRRLFERVVTARQQQGAVSGCGLAPFPWAWAFPWAEDKKESEGKPSSASVWGSPAVKPDLAASAVKRRATAMEYVAAILEIVAYVKGATEVPEEPPHFDVFECTHVCPFLHRMT